MACNFSILFSGSAEQALNKARSSVQGQGGTFDGDTSKGNFKVSAFGNTIAGSYTVEGQELKIDISDKPFLLTCGMIESYLKSQIK